MASDHEVVAADGVKAITLVEATGAVIVDIDAELNVARALEGGGTKRPVHQRCCNSGALPILEHVQLTDLDRVGRSLDRQLGRAELYIADDPPGIESRPEGEAIVLNFRAKPIGCHRAQEVREVLGPIKMTERVDEAGPEDTSDGFGILWFAIAICDRHSNPAGAGQSGEW